MDHRRFWFKEKLVIMVLAGSNGFWSIWILLVFCVLLVYLIQMGSLVFTGHLVLSGFLGFTGFP